MPAVNKGPATAATTGANSIKVVARFRPLNATERLIGGDGCATLRGGKVDFLYTENRNPNAVITKDDEHNFEFDHAFGGDSTQEELFACTGQQIVEDVFQGYNGTIMAYGQTGSGKTHSMMGPGFASTPGSPRGCVSPRAQSPRWARVQGSPLSPSGSMAHLPKSARLVRSPTLRSPTSVTSPTSPKKAKAVPPEESKGIIPRVLESIFARVASQTEEIFHVKVSFMEIYQEQIRDLLDPTKDNLQLHEDLTGGKGVYVQNATETSVSSQDEVLKLMALGNNNRMVASTGMNERSSRSHSIFLITLSRKHCVTLDSTTGKLFLVDLAGSEQVKKTSAQGQQLEEAKLINKSLSALGNVIRHLTDATFSHVPYRDSKLTRLLQDSLGGNSRTTLIICCSPSPYNANETLSTLRFGQRAKTIKNKAKVNTSHEDFAAELQSMLAKAELENARLQDALQAAESFRQKPEDIQEQIERATSRKDDELKEAMELLRQAQEENRLLRESIVRTESLHFSSPGSLSPLNMATISPRSFTLDSVADSTPGSMSARRGLTLSPLVAQHNEKEPDGPEAGLPAIQAYVHDDPGFQALVLCEFPNKGTANPDEARVLWELAGYDVLDVRSALERDDRGSITAQTGSVHIPMFSAQKVDDAEAGAGGGAQVVNPAWMEQVRARFPEAQSKIIVMCSDGRERTHQALEALDAEGYTNLVGLKGGFNRWNWTFDAELDRREWGTGSPTTVNLESMQDEVEWRKWDAVVEEFRAAKVAKIGPLPDAKILACDDAGFRALVQWEFPDKRMASPEEARVLWESVGYSVLDVRSCAERKDPGGLTARKGSVHIPMFRAKKVVDAEACQEAVKEEVNPAWVEQVRARFPHLESRIVVMCSDGRRRTHQALAILQADGYSNVVGLKGGFNNWASSFDAALQRRNSGEVEPLLDAVEWKQWTSAVAEFQAAKALDMPEIKAMVYDDVGFQALVRCEFPDKRIASTDEARVLWELVGYDALDLRCDWEREDRGTKKGSVHIPMFRSKKVYDIEAEKEVLKQEVNPAWVEQVKARFPNPQSKIIAMCSNGCERTQQALAALESEGYCNVVGLKGGFNAWSKTFDYQMQRRDSAAAIAGENLDSGLEDSMTSSTESDDVEWREWLSAVEESRAAKLVKAEAMPKIKSRSYDDVGFQALTTCEFPDKRIASPDEARVLWEMVGYDVLDVRSGWEREDRGSIKAQKGSVHIPMFRSKKVYDAEADKDVIKQEVNPAWMEQVKARFADPESKLIVMCSDGSRRSHEALEELEREGYMNAVGLKGGFNKWDHTFDATLRRSVSETETDDSVGEIYDGNQWMEWAVAVQEFRAAKADVTPEIKAMVYDDVGFQALTKCQFPDKRIASPDEARVLWESSGYDALDVRCDWEREDRGSIKAQKGSVHIPMFRSKKVYDAEADKDVIKQEVNPAWMEQVKARFADPESKLIVMCSDGSRRTQQALEALEQEGYSNVVGLQGGFNRWDERFDAALQPCDRGTKRDEPSDDVVTSTKASRDDVEWMHWISAVEEWRSSSIARRDGMPQIKAMVYDDVGFQALTKCQFPDKRIASPDEARVLWESSGYDALDVRCDWEREDRGSIKAQKGSVHIPMFRSKKVYDAEADKDVIKQEVNPAWMEQVKARFADPESKLIVMCSDGSRRTQQALEALEQEGYSNVVGLQGGFNNWDDTFDAAMQRRTPDIVVERTVDLHIAETAALTMGCAKAQCDDIEWMQWASAAEEFRAVKDAQADALLDTREIKAMVYDDVGFQALTKCQFPDKRIASPDEARVLWESAGYDALDVRCDWEREDRGSIKAQKGSVHIPMFRSKKVYDAEADKDVIKQEVNPAWMEQVKARFADPESKLIVMCSDGSRRTQQALEALEQEGYSNVVGLQGGFNRWDERFDAALQPCDRGTKRDEPSDDVVTSTKASRDDVEWMHWIGAVEEFWAGKVAKVDAMAETPEIKAMVYDDVGFQALTKCQFPDKRIASPDEARVLWESSGYDALDVRCDWEREDRGSIKAQKGSVHIPMFRSKKVYDAEADKDVIKQEVNPAWMEQVKARFADPESKLIVMCSDGSRRTQQALEALEQEGYSNVVGLQGGFNRWDETFDVALQRHPCAAVESTSATSKAQRDDVEWMQWISAVEDIKATTTAGDAAPPELKDTVHDDQSSRAASQGSAAAGEGLAVAAARHQAGPKPLREFEWVQWSREACGDDEESLVTTSYSTLPIPTARSHRGSLDSEVYLVDPAAANKAPEAEKCEFACGDGLADPEGGLTFVFGYNWFGQLGLQHTSSRNVPTLLGSPNGMEITRVAFGGFHSAFMAGDDLYVFGYNRYGQLGLGHNVKQSQPVPLPAPNGKGISAFALGASHTAVVAGGELYMFGCNRHGQLGQGDRAHRSAPVRVEAPNGAAVTHVALGEQHSAFVAGGELFMMGDNAYGQLGLGDFARRAAPARVAPPNGKAVAAVSLGCSHSAFVAGGELYVFGYNLNGQVGAGNVMKQNRPFRVPCPNGAPVTGCHLGGHQSALIAGGELFVMGRNGNGQLGVGHRSKRYAPAKVASPNGPVTDVRMGEAHGVFVSGEELFVFGSSKYGQLGLGDYAQHHKPRRLVPPNDRLVVGIAVGSYHTAVWTGYRPANRPEEGERPEPKRGLMGRLWRVATWRSD